MLELRNLTAHYGKNEVVSGASIVLNPGEVVA
jgi:ABC-type branched-subunit amino acid transport system ATPase component